ncbi:Os06g0559600 [Oryza sativa Japonica Group]|uniref:Os06g0559600 protein n=2 Tax=Oryza TaxID=4527 RepID=A0A0P0WY69_ORYSJ|nr:hypothetical protein EE612_034810 [Oryza sativa]BAS98243.1 Os06g0559600 [Oryza sativa Japonica Group]
MSPFRTRMAMILRTSKCDNKVARQLDDEVVWHEEARCKGDVVTLRQRAGEVKRPHGDDDEEATQRRARW